MELSPAWIGIIIIVLGHVITTVWWAAKVSTLLVMVQKSLENLSIDMKSVSVMYVSKDELTRALTVAKQEREAMWRKVDKQDEIIEHIRDKVLSNSKGYNHG